MFTTVELFVVIGTAVVTALTATLWRTGLHLPSTSAADPVPADPPALLFDDGVLHHGNTAGLMEFAMVPGGHVWADLRDRLGSRFPDLPLNPGTGACGSMTIPSRQTGDPQSLEMQWRDGLCWVQLMEPDPATKVPLSEGPTRTSFERCADSMPHPAWETDLKGRLRWCKTAYREHVQRFQTDEDVMLFPAVNKDSPERISICSPSGATHWFEVTAQTTKDARMYHATDISALVAAEGAQRAFVQTLAKTFAHLTVGLAIFDRKGKLAIFNPALVDLSGLPPAFLVTQPTMMTFFDALRENRRMPEPKNYRTWRQDISDMIAAASGGQYHETWSLEDGQTYAVQGRPHPDGTTAFLIEDISAEITLSRSYRTEIEQFESVLDSLPDALAVFSASGVLTLCNAAYRTLWDQNPEAAFADMTVQDAAALWRNRLRPDTDWAAFTAFVTVRGLTDRRGMDLDLSDGTRVRCTISRLSGDAILFHFSRLTNNAGTRTKLVLSPGA